MANEDVFDGVPQQLFGYYQLKTKTQIVLHYLLPAIFELFIYIILTVADVTLIVQHFRDTHAIWASLTLTFVVLPAVLCFVTIIGSPSQWPAKCKREEKQQYNNNKRSTEDINAEAVTIRQQERRARKTTGTKCANCKFFLRHLFNLIIFPIGSIYRYSRKIFWSVEALFHDENNNNRYRAVQKASETSSFELYHFLQAYTQAAPQIILQLYIVMHESVFRNYETTIPQTLSIIFSFIKMGVTAVTYHRFESQHIVGRHYPWMDEEVCRAKTAHLRKSTNYPSQQRSRADSVWTPIVDLSENDENRRHSNEMLLKNINFTDDDKIEVQRTKQIDLDKPSTSKQCDEIDSVEVRKKVAVKTNMPDDEIVSHIQEMKDDLREQDDYDSKNSVEVTNFDRTPSLPPPPRPTSLYLPPFMKLGTLKDMLWFDAQHLIKTHVPHLPPGLFDDTTNDDDDDDKKRRHATSDDTTDFLQLPTRKRTINGLEQDDIFGKYICFLAWFLFLVMRMLALATFSVFHLRETIFLCLSHYLVMLLCLYAETRSHSKVKRKIFYAFLAYIYIFCLIEFKIKFVHIKTWYVGYFLLVLTQNLSITMIWYLTTTEELLLSWWFQFMWYLIICSALLSIACHIFYYVTLKPKDKILFVNDDEQK